MKHDMKVYIAGHSGMVGSAILRKLRASGYANVLTTRRDELDLRSQPDVERFFAAQRIDIVVLAAARVGGIHANQSLPAEFIRDNLMIELNVIDSAHRHGVGHLLFLGSSCIYPRLAEQPIREESLLRGPLEPTNESYAIAKIAGIQLCASYARQYGRDYRCLMPTNLYGPGDNFCEEYGHVIPALMRRLHSAVRSADSELVVWGSGTPIREFLHVDDLADAAVHVLELDRERFQSVLEPGMAHLNVGTGRGCSIRELAERLAVIAGFRGSLRFDPSRPDGTPRKVLDVSRLSALGWKARIELEEGLEETYAWFAGNFQSARS